MTEQARTKLLSELLQVIYDELTNARHAAVAPRAAAAAPVVRSPCIPAELDLIIQFRGDAGPIEQLALGRFAALDPFPDTGVRTGAGLFPSENVAALAALPNVITIREPETIRTTLEHSLPETRTTDLRAQFSWMTGLGVTIVLIDAGIEWRHGAFMDKDGKSRIQKLWDLTHSAGPGETAGPGNRGVVYRNDDIDNHHTIHSKDEGAGGHGHGSIVAGIAAGNGAPRSCTFCGCCRRGGVFVGVAPEADIIAVRVNSVAHILVALTLLAHDPDLAGKRVVLNISMGMDDGPHDGTHPLELAIDRFTASGPTRFVVVAAGNSTGHNSHAFGTVPAAVAGQPRMLDVPVFTAKHDAASSTLVFYHQAADPLTVQVISPLGTVSAAFPTSTNGRQTTNVDGVAIALAGAPLQNGPDGGEVELRLTATGPGTSLERDDHWIIRFSNAGAHDVAIDCRVATSLGHPSWRFVAPGETAPAGLRSSDQGTITTPATAKTAIAVANYKNKESRCDVFWSGDIASDSGRGPARGAAAALTKPAIAAPGESITAPKADAFNLRGNLGARCRCPDWLIALYDDDSGTSMAAPHVTGAIALMLQVNQTMTMEQLQRYLHDSARSAPAPADPNIWGHGKLDVNHAVALALKDSLPPPSPTPSLPLAAAPAPAVARAEVTPGPLGMRAAAPAFGTLIDSLRAAPDGERFAALVSRHFSEVRRLINAHPKVATLWHRADGPAMLRQLALRHGGPHGHPALHSPSQRDYFRRFLGQLHRFASPRLATTLEHHGDRLVDWLATPA